MSQNIITFVKCFVASVGGWFVGVLSPALPFGFVCTVMVIVDVVSARRLARRLALKYPAKNLKFTSAKFSKVITTLIRIYAVLLLAALVQGVILEEMFDLLKFVAGIICFWQTLSILENEASCNDNQWAKVLGKVLIDKTERHLGINLEDLRNSIDEKSKSEVESQSDK